jgi:hypothetical protein
MNGLVRSTIHQTEMADLLNLLADVASGRRMSANNQRMASNLRETIIAGTPEAERTVRG